MHSLPPIPRSRAFPASRAVSVASSSEVVTPSSGPGRSARREARTSSHRAGSSTPGICAQRRSAQKSTEPKARRITPGTPAIARHCARPRAVSTRASKGMSARAAAMRLRSSGDSALGTMTAAGRSAAAAARSSACQAVAAALMRTITGSVVKSRRSAARAVALAAGATASSRSRITASAPEAAALPKRSGRSAGTNRGARTVPIRSGAMRSGVTIPPAPPSPPARPRPQSKAATPAPRPAHSR